MNLLKKRKKMISLLVWFGYICLLRQVKSDDVQSVDNGLPSPTQSIPHNKEGPPLKLSSVKQQSKPYYSKSAITFLREYGQHYRLFDMFFSPNSSIIQRELSNEESTSTESPNNNNNNEVRIHQEDIERNYHIKDYSRVKQWSVATARPHDEYVNVTFKYNPPVTSDELLQYNNIFRYGPDIDDRFLSIGFSIDPWSEVTTSTPAYVHFVGINNNLPLDTKYTCSFRSPIQIDSTIEVTAGLNDVLSRPTKENIIKCKIPQKLIDALTNDTREIELDLIKTKFDTPSVMLHDIKIPRLHSTDRKHYTHVLQTMVEIIDDIMVKEWVIYNILLGIEHFYIFYNTKRSDFDINTSILRPFLDANIITIIYFPFLHTHHYEDIQHGAMNVYLHQYGSMSEWVGYWDIDEFFLPGRRFLPDKIVKDANTSLVALVTKTLAPGKEPGIMYDTMDMACNPDDHNFYYGGNNLFDYVNAKGAPRPETEMITQKPVRNAVSTHCLRTGYLFHEMKQSHGKMFIRNSRVPHMHSPHRLNDFWVVWTNPPQDGTFRHFNNFRNTNGMIKQNQFSEKDIGSDTSLQELTLSLLKNRVGIYEADVAVVPSNV